MDKNITIYCIYSIVWTRILQYIAYIVYYGQPDNPDNVTTIKFI